MKRSRYGACIIRMAPNDWWMGRFVLGLATDISIYIYIYIYEYIWYISVMCQLWFASYCMIHPQPLLVSHIVNGNYLHVWLLLTRFDVHQYMTILSPNWLSVQWYVPYDVVLATRNVLPLYMVTGFNFRQFCLIFSDVYIYIYIHIKMCIYIFIYLFIYTQYTEW